MTIFRHRISPIPRAGFTLIEVLVVICIVAVLAGLIMPVLANIRQRANAATCLSNLRQIGMGASMEEADNGGTCPTGWNSLIIPDILIRLGPISIPMACRPTEGCSDVPAP